MNTKLKKSLFFGAIGLIAGGLMGNQLLFLLPVEQKYELVSELGSENLFILLSAIQTAILSFVTGFIGLNLSGKLGLKLNFNWNKKSFLLSTFLGFACAISMSVLDRFIFYNFIAEQISNVRFSISGFLATIIYGGIFEEIFARLFMMSLMGWIALKCLKNQSSEAVPSWVFVFAVIVSALLFALGHLPATSVFIGLSFPILVRAILLNGLVGIVYGYIYWKKGLAYAMNAHMFTHVFNQLIFAPLLFY